MIQSCIAAHGSYGAKASEHDPETEHVESEHAQWIDEEVHRECVGDVLGLCQTCLHHCKTGLHEHDEEPCDQRPHHIDRYFVVADGSEQFRRSGLVRVFRPNISYASGIGTAWIWPSLGLGECGATSDPEN